MSERISIDTSRYQLLQEPGLRPPKERLTYASPEVQELVGRCFGHLLPRIHFDSEGRPYYELLDENGNDRCVQSRSISEMEEIPAEELFLLDEGLRELHALSGDPSLDSRLRRLLAEFQLPDPESELRRYRLYEQPDGRRCLLVMWGFSAVRRRGHFMPATTALSLLKARVDTSAVREAAETIGGIGSDSGHPLPETPGLPAAARLAKETASHFWGGIGAGTNRVFRSLAGR